MVSCFQTLCTQHHQYISNELTVKISRVNVYAPQWWRRKREKKHLQAVQQLNSKKQKFIFYRKSRRECRLKVLQEVLPKHGLEDQAVHLEWTQGKQREEEDKESIIFIYSVKRTVIGWVQEFIAPRNISFTMNSLKIRSFQRLNSFLLSSQIRK